MDFFSNILGILYKKKQQKKEIQEYRTTKSQGFVVGLYSEFCTWGLNNCCRCLLFTSPQFGNPVSLVFCNPSG